MGLSYTSLAGSLISDTANTEPEEGEVTSF